MSGVRESVLAVFRYRRPGLFALAVLVGVVSGLGAVLFRTGIDSWGALLSGTADYTRSLGPSTGVLAPLGRWFVLVAPVLSGLVLGPLMAWAGASPTGHGVGGLIYSARRGDGTMPLRPAIVSTLSSALAIGGGGSVGPEGPIAELGASVGSTLGRLVQVPTRTLKVLAAAGTAAGIAAAFGAPLAGAFFALEVILLDFTAETFGYVVVSCVASSLVATHLMGTSLSLSLPSGLALGGETHLVWVALLGLLGGAVGILFSRTRFLLTDLVDRTWRGPVWLRPAVGGLGVGAILLMSPEMYGESSAVLDRALHGSYATGVLLGFMVAKIVATAYTLAVVRVGGVFAPSLFVGGMLGAAFGTVVAPDSASSAAVYGVIGMGAVFTGAARAPITGIVLIVEMTGQYALLLPLMLAIALATAMSRFLTRTTIYTEELRRRGEDVEDPVRATLVGRATARTLMQSPPAVLTVGTSLTEAAAALRAAGVPLLPVVEPAAGGSGDQRDGSLWRGCVSAITVANALAGSTASSAQPRTVGDLDLDLTHVTTTDGASRVLEALVSSHAEALPVIRTGPDGRPLLAGWVSQGDMVRRLYRQQRRAVEAAEARTSLGSRIQSRWRARHTS